MPSKADTLAKGTRAARRAQTAVEASETIHVSPLMPFGSLRKAEWYQRQYSPQSMKDMFIFAQMLVERNPYFGPVVETKCIWYADGAGFEGDNPNTPLNTWHMEMRLQGFDLAQLVRDVMLEYNTKDNAVAVWFPSGGSKGAPSIAVVDCERCDYADAYGMPELKIDVTKNEKLEPAVADRMGKKWAEAIKKGEAVKLNRIDGDFFRVMSNAKTGRGFAKPTVTQLVMEFGITELLAVADWAGAYTHGDVIRLALKGHEITQGDRAGLTDHFMTLVNQTKIREALKSKRGAYDMVSNFDFSILYSFLDPKFFTGTKYQATAQKIQRWAGGAGALLIDGEMKSGVLKAMQMHGKWIRGRVAAFLEPILNSKEIWPEDKAPPEILKLRFDPNTFLDSKFLFECMRLAHTNGWLSPQTARLWLGLENALESANLKAAHDKPDEYSPAFQSHQGDQSVPGKQNSGGRPSDKPASETPTPQGD